MTASVLTLTLGVEIGLAAGYALGFGHRWIRESRLTLLSVFGYSPDDTGPKREE